MRLKRVISVISVTMGLLSIPLTYQACSEFVPLDAQELYGKTGGAPLGSTDTLNLKTAEVLKRNCAGCHDGQNFSGTALSYTDDLGLLAKSFYVIPGNPLASSLYKVMANGSMPPSSALAADDLQIVFNWIEALGSTPMPTPIPTPTPVAATPTPTPIIVVPTPTPTPKPTPTPVNAMATFTYIKNNILEPQCRLCHGGAGGTYGNVSFSTYATTFKAVVAGKPEFSPLYLSVANGSMPRGGNKLSAQQLKAISDWIANGALNN